MFARVNTLGWALFEQLTSAQMNQLDLNVSRSLDGLNGGEYTLTAPLIIHGTVSFDTLGGTFESAFVSNHSFESNGSSTTINTTTFVVDDGTTFTINSTNVFTSSSETSFASGAALTFDVGSTIEVNSASFDFNAGFDVTGGATNFQGTVTFIDQPTFSDGLIIGTDDEINYAGTGRGWVVNYPFMAGYSYSGDYYQPHPTGNSIRQTDNTIIGFGARWFCFPQGSWGATPITIENAEAVVEAQGTLSGTVGDTEFLLQVIDRDYSAIETRTLRDATPNLAAVHYAQLAGFTDLAYNPTTQILGMTFQGYDGGDTLNNVDKWYNLYSYKLTLRALAMGVY